MYYNLLLQLLLLLQPPQFMNLYEDGQQIDVNEKVEMDQFKNWDDLLSKYVDATGNVNYKGLKTEESTLDAYLKNLAEAPPSESSGRSEKLVYYINLYNAATVKLILENYPVNSIKDLNKPWEKKWVRVGEKTISLATIEHKILRKLDEPRIHFAINCASYSCPRLLNRAYTLEKLEQDLEEVTREFVNDEKRNKIGSEEAEISAIFKWYKSDFTRNTSLADYINRYSDIKIGPGTKIKYLKYDWSLNEIRE